MPGTFNIQVNLDDKDKSALETADMLNSVKTTGDVDVTDPPITDTVMHTQGAKITTIHAQRTTNSSKQLTAQEKVEVNIGKRYYKKVGLYIQGIATDVAIAAGDINAGIAVVERCGYKVKNKPSSHAREFEIVASGPGWFHARIKSVGKRAVYVWKIGITTQKGVKSSTFISEFFSTECEIIVTEIESGVTYCIVEATVLPVPKKTTKNKGATHLTNEMTLQTSAGTGKPSYALGSDPYNWTDPIYHVGV